MITAKLSRNSSVKSFPSAGWLYLLESSKETAVANYLTIYRRHHNHCVADINVGNNSCGRGTNIRVNPDGSSSMHICGILYCIPVEISILLSVSTELVES